MFEHFRWLRENVEKVWDLILYQLFHFWYIIKLDRLYSKICTFSKSTEKIILQTNWQFYTLHRLEIKYETSEIHKWNMLKM